MAGRRSRFKKAKRFFPWAFLALCAGGCTLSLPILGKVLLPSFPGCASRDILPPPPNSRKPSAGPASPAPAAAQASPTPVPLGLASAAPAFSPTPLGETIYFVSQDQNHLIIMGIAPDGSGLRRVTDASASSWAPVASLDGKVIGFTSDRGKENGKDEGNVEFWVADPTGANAHALSHGGKAEPKPNPEAAPRGSFAPDGLSAAWIENGELWLGTLDGLNPETLASHMPFGFVESVWYSPTGWEVAYHLRRGTSDMGIWTIPVAGRKPVQRVGTTIRSPFLAWHPQGRQFLYWKAGPVRHSLDIGDKIIAQEEVKVGQFCGARDGNAMAYVKRAPNETDGPLLYIPTDKDPVTIVDKGVSDPTFSPDGKKLAFRMDGDLWVISADGKDRRRLTVIGAWSPCWAASPSSPAKPSGPPAKNIPPAPVKKS